jgi:hypothetical protein
MKKLFMVIGVIHALVAMTVIQSLAEGDGIYGFAGEINPKLSIVEDPGKSRVREPPVPWEIMELRQRSIDLVMLGRELGQARNLSTPGSTEIICLGVYDGIGRFLGYLAGEVDGYTVEVLDPDTMRFYKVNTRPPVPIAEPVYVAHDLLYTEPDCQGIPYVNPFGDFFGVIRFKPDNTYWIIDPELGPTKKERDMRSISNSSPSDPDQCVNFVSPPHNDIPCFPVKQIDSWWTTVMLEYPIEVRPIE